MTSLGLTDVRSVLARSGLLLAVAAAIVLAPGLTPDPGLRAVVPWFAVLLMLELAPVLWPRRPDLFAPPAFAGIIAALGTAASLVAMFAGGGLTLRFVSLTRPEQVTALAEKVLLAQILGLGCYYAGYYTRLGVGLARFFPRVAGLTWDRARVRLVGVAAAIVFVATYAVFQARVGVPLFDITQLGLGKQVWRNDPTLSWMMRGVEVGFLPVLMMFAARLARDRGARSLIVPTLLLLAVGLLGFRLGQRGPFPAVVLAVVIMFHYHRRRVPPVVFVAVCFLAIAIGNITLAWRTEPAAQERTFALVAEASDPARLLENHESERQRFSGLALVMSEFPDPHPYLLGESWAALVAVPIPRWIWPDKVHHFEWQDNRIIFRLGGPPMPTPFVGALYANFSWLGIVLGTLLFGAFHRGLYEWLRAHDRDRNVVLLYALTVVYFGPSLLNITGTVQYIIPMWLAVRFMGRRRAPARPA